MAIAKNIQARHTTYK